MIIKMQKSIFSSDNNEVILLTNLANTFECMTPIDDKSKELLKNRHTAYFEATLINKQILIRNEVPSQGW